MVDRLVGDQLANGPLDEGSLLKKLEEASAGGIVRFEVALLRLSLRFLDRATESDPDVFRWDVFRLAAEALSPVDRPAFGSLVGEAS